MVATGLNLKGVVGIYGIIHRESGRVYVGQSRNMANRIKSHRCHSNKDKRQGKFYNAVRKYGKEEFDFEILEEFSAEDLNEREKFYIQFLNAIDSGFNLSPEPGKSRFGVPQSAETNAKVSAALTGRKLTPEQCAAISKRLKGRVITPEQRAKISAKLTGRVRPQHERDAVSRGGKGRVVSEETRAKIGARHRGKIVSKEVGDKISAANSRPVFQIDFFTGEIIAEFPSVALAAKHFNCNQDSIRDNLRGQIKKSQGFVWKFKTQPTTKEQ